MSFVVGGVLVFLFTAPAMYLIGVRGDPPFNQAIVTPNGLSDGWAMVNIFGKHLNQKIALRDSALKIDGAIDSNVFREDPAFGGDGTPRILEGSDGFLFLKDAFDAACNPHGTPELVSANIKRFSEILTRAGKKAVVVVAPDKSTVLPEKLPEGFPLIPCHRTNQDKLWRALRDARIPGYLDLRDILRRQVQISREPLYMRHDSHWDSAGALTAIRAVVDYLKPGVWRDTDIQYQGLIEYSGDLESMRGGSQTDQTPQYVVNRPDISFVRTEEDSSFSPGYRRFSETKGLPNTLVTGKTVVLYDSFGMLSYDKFTPFFENLETLHFFNFDPEPWIERLKAADNIWFMSVERSFEYRLTYDMGASSFLDALEKALSQ
jgi:hypothetical protein